MKAPLERMAQALVREMDITGVINHKGTIFTPNSLQSSQSPYAGLCHGAYEKLADMVAHVLPDSTISKLAFTRKADQWADRGRHVIAQVITAGKTYLIDPTIGQFEPDAPTVYSRDDEYPIPFYLESLTLKTKNNGV